MYENQLETYRVRREFRGRTCILESFGESASFTRVAALIPRVSSCPRVRSELSCSAIVAEKRKLLNSAGGQA